MVFALLKAVFGLAFTLGLIGLATYAARRWGPAGLFQARAPRQRRISIVESLTLDPSRRVVLVRFEAQEHLLLLGEGRLLETRAALADPALDADVLPRALSPLQARPSAPVRA